jgi:hypothetical protein
MGARETKNKGATRPIVLILTIDYPPMGSVTDPEREAPRGRVSELSGQRDHFPVPVSDAE